MILAGCTLASAGASGIGRMERLPDLDPSERDLRAQSDTVLLRSYARGIDNLLEQLDQNNALWNKDRKTPLSPDERRLALSLFGQVLSYVIALDSMAEFHFDFWRIDVLKDPVRHAQHFALAFAAYCVKVQLGLAFIDKTLNKPQFEKLLDEGSREYGLPPGVYGRLKWNVVHVEAVSRVLTMHQYHKILPKKAYAELRDNSGEPSPVQLADRSYDAIKSRLLRQGAQLFAGNAFDILKDKGHGAWFPLQAQVAELMGDTKVHRLDVMLISGAQVEEVAAKSQPGDIIVERRNWYLSNVALPGFWPHNALWLGTPVELAAFFDADAEVTAAFGGDFTATLAIRYPDAWRIYTGKDPEGHPHRLIEAVSEGVVFTSAEHSVRCDYAAAMRPRLSKVELARAIDRAFHYHGRPYDFDFDFFTDAALVCSELIYKAYEPRSDARGLKFELEEIAGRMTLGPNSMVRLFDRQLGTREQQLDFVWFLDGREKERDAVWRNQASFRASHKRFKWDIAQK
jgi:hypothetical protein